MKMTIRFDIIFYLNVIRKCKFRRLSSCLNYKKLVSVRPPNVDATFGLIVKFYFGIQNE